MSSLPPAPKSSIVRRGVFLFRTAADPILRALTAGVRLIVQAVLALIIVFEEWGWRPLAALLGRLAHLRPIAWIEAQIQRLPPYGALVVFGAPSLLILPLKLAAVYLIASGHTTQAAALFIGAKIAGTAIIARLFHLTEHQLLQIPWFARAYGRFVPWKEALASWVRRSWPWRMGRVLKTRLRRAVRPWGLALQTWLRPRARR